MNVNTVSVQHCMHVSSVTIVCVCKTDKLSQELSRQMGLAGTGKPSCTSSYISIYSIYQYISVNISGKLETLIVARVTTHFVFARLATCLYIGNNASLTNV